MLEALPETLPERDFTPNWETTAQYLLLNIKDSTNPLDREWAESEVVLMGRIIDELQEQKKEKYLPPAGAIDPDEVATSNLNTEPTNQPES